MSTVILALSGGMDSTTLLWLARSQGHDVKCVFFDYGSKHNPYERVAVNKICNGIGLSYATVDLSNVFVLFESNLLKQGDDVPEAHYTDPVQKATIVPGRNLILASILAGIAQSNYPESEVWMGMHTGDFEIYPDCRPHWITHLTATVRLQSEGRVLLRAPWVEWSMNKSQILETGLRLDVPYKVTRTCYKDQPIACGVCGSCTERLEAFENMDQTDPLRYEVDFIEGQ